MNQCEVDVYFTLTHVEAVFKVSLDLLGDSLGRFWDVPGRLGVVLERLGASWCVLGRLGASWTRFGGVFGAFWGRLGASLLRFGVPQTPGAGYFWAVLNGLSVFLI